MWTLAEWDCACKAFFSRSVCTLISSVLEYMCVCRCDFIDFSLSLHKYKCHGCACLHLKINENLSFWLLFSKLKNIIPFHCDTIFINLWHFAIYFGRLTFVQSKSVIYLNSRGWMCSLIKRPIIISDVSNKISTVCGNYWFLMCLCDVFVFDGDFFCKCIGRSNNTRTHRDMKHEKNQ